MNSTLTNQEIEELRIAIAEEMGWHVEVDDDQFWRATDSKGNRNSSLWCSQDAAIRDLPEYTTSIDAIQVACLERFKSGEDAFAFHGEIIRLECGGDKYCWQLTALDWSIAFAHTAKIWRHKV